VTTASSEGPATPAPRWQAPALLKRNRRSLTSLVAVVVALTAWEGIVRVFSIPRFIVPAPSAIVTRFIESLDDGLLLNHTMVTAQEIVAGYVLGSALGIGLGVLVSQSETAEAAVYPFVVALNSVPKVAISPLIVLWFGFGFQSKIVIAALVSFFPLFVNVVAGLQSVDAEQVRLMRALTASRWATFRHVQLPNALPSIFAGLEIAIVLSVVGAIVGEFVGAREGLGYYIQLSNSLLDTTGMFVAFILLAAVGTILNQVVKVLARRIVFWRRVDSGLTM
jgi:NitT/TauT family transport system permease protein